MLSKKHLKTIQFLALSSFVIFGYQNCADQVQFTHDNTSKSLELTPNSKTQLQPVKILFLIDPSPSMVDDLSKMNSALNVFLDSLKTLPVEIKLESVIQQAAEISIKYKDPTTKKNITSKTIAIHPDETESMRSYKTEAIKKTINDYVQNALQNRQAQDEIEVPVCKAMFNLLSPLAKFFVSNETQKDSGAIVLISDEDETILSSSTYCTLDSVSSQGVYIPEKRWLQQAAQVALKTANVHFSYDKYDEGGVFIKTESSSQTISNMTLSQPVACSETIKNEVQTYLKQQENKYYRNYRVTGCSSVPFTKFFAHNGDVNLKNILNTDEVQQFAIQGKLDPYLKIKRDFHNSDYYDSFLFATPPAGVTKADWEADDYCTRKSNYPLANKSMNPMTINEFLDYLNPNGTTTFVVNVERKCYYEKQERSSGGYYSTGNTPVYARPFLAKFLNLPNESTESGEHKHSIAELAQMAIDKKYGLNRIVIYGLYNTQAVSNSDNGKQGLLIQEFIKSVNGESADINQGTYNASFDRIKELIFERIVGKSLSVPYDLKHEYVKSVSVKTSAGEVLILKEGEDFKLTGNILVFLNYDPAHDDKFLVVIESVPLI